MSLYRLEHICDYLPQKFLTQTMATHGEPANVSYFSHTELRINELTFRTSRESFVISAVITWKSKGNLSKESLQNLGNLSRSNRTLCRLRFSQYFFIAADILSSIIIDITRQQLSLKQNWSWKKRRKRTTPKACRSVFDERRSQRLFTFCGSPHACFVKLLEVCHELRSSAFLLPCFLWLFW